ncbi:DNA polymerase V subunit UmuC [Salmonella enterica subsp. salamae]|nr:DNA polymerase V subunit UmuC [Salmonella enterica subsp. salamae]
MFALADVNSFYASCEKVFRPDLRNRGPLGKRKISYVKAIC